MTLTNAQLELAVQTAGKVTFGDGWEKLPGLQRPRTYILAALPIIAEARDEQWERAVSVWLDRNYGKEVANASAIARSIRASLDKPKTPEERVTVDNNQGIYARCQVYLDGSPVCNDFYRSEDAEIYRLGLIEKLKREGK